MRGVDQVQNHICFPKHQLEAFCQELLHFQSRSQISQIFSSAAKQSEYILVNTKHYICFKETVDCNNNMTFHTISELACCTIKWPITSFPRFAAHRGQTWDTKTQSLKTKLNGKKKLNETKKFCYIQKHFSLSLFSHCCFCWTSLLLFFNMHRLKELYQFSISD